MKMSTCELASLINEMNPCELIHFMNGDKPVSKYELHWVHNYNSKTSFISERDYYDLMDQHCEELLAIWLNGKYNNEARVCMTVTQ